MRVFTLILLLSSSILATAAVAQDKGGVSGRVTDKRSGHALAFATVSIVGVPKGGLTDSEGQFLIAGLAPGTYDVRVQFLGYRLETRTGVVVAAGRPTTVNFALEEVVVQQEKVIEVTAERRLVEARQGATIRSVTAGEIRNLPVQTIGDVLQQQAGVSNDNDQLHVRGGRADETIFVVNGVTNRDLVTGQSTAGQLPARSVAEVNVATGAYDVRFGNALSGVIEIKLKEGSDKFAGGVTTTAGSYGGRAWQLLLSGPDPAWQPLLRLIGLPLPGSVTSVLDVTSSLAQTRYSYLGRSDAGPLGYMLRMPPARALRSSYEDVFFTKRFRYGSFFSPSADNRWSARYGLTWKPNPRDKVAIDFSKRISIDQGFTRSFLNASGDKGDPAYPWAWAQRIEHAPTYFEDNTTESIEWRRTFSTTAYSELQLSRYFYAQRQDVLGKRWDQYDEPVPQAADSFFIRSGDADEWSDLRTQSYDLQWTLVQRLRRNEIEVGFDHQLQTVQSMTIQRPWVADPNNLGDVHDLWRTHPWTGSFFLRDKIEYEGFTANVGLRGDYWFLGREGERALADSTNENVTPETRSQFYSTTHSFFGRRYKLKLAPRVIVAHPITENSSFFFNYGQFTQIPAYQYVFWKLSSRSSESFPRLGNPNLNPQVAVNYEVGGKHQFARSAAANVTFFVKDLYDYPSSVRFQPTGGRSLAPFYVYLNGHFARAKGFEIVLEKRRSQYWSGKVTYTFQQTKGKSSDPNDQGVVSSSTSSATEARLSQVFMSWNRPHKLALNLDARFDQETPDGLWWAKRTGLNLYIQGTSGRAYTPSSSGLSQAAEPYSGNGPFQVTTDLRLNRWFRAGGRRYDLSLAGTNIFSNLLVNRIDPKTGQARIWGVGSYDPSDPSNRLGNQDYTYTKDILDPSNFGPGAQWRLALDVDF